VRVDGVYPSGIEIVVECPECDSEYFVCVQPSDFANVEHVDG
jgi:hypothetical protein